jgi:hypothetical protein
MKYRIAYDLNNGEVISVDMVGFMEMDDQDLFFAITAGDGKRFMVADGKVVEVKPEDYIENNVEVNIVPEGEIVGIKEEDYIAQQAEIVEETEVKEDVVEQVEEIKE